MKSKRVRVVALIVTIVVFLAGVIMTLTGIFTYQNVFLVIFGTIIAAIGAFGIGALIEKWPTART